MVQVSDSARTELDAFFADKPKSGIRIYLAPGGCSGPRLALALDEATENDKSFEANGYTFCLDTETGEYLVGGIYEVDGESYYFRPAGSKWGPAGSMGTGWVTGYNGYDFFFDRTTGHMYMGGNLIDGVG
jgi:Fe-S cluster assembly iron-binding protein IscA